MGLMMFATKTLQGAQIAMWTVAALSVALGVFKGLEYLLTTAGLIKSSHEKTLQALQPDLVKVREIHKTITDRVNTGLQEQSFKQVQEIALLLKGLLPWFKVPPEVTTPVFWCQSKETSEQVQALQARWDEKEKQMTLIVSLLERIIDREIDP